MGTRLNSEIRGSTDENFNCKDGFSMLCDDLKALKEKKKLTNQEISELSGIPVSTVARILSGQTDNPSFQTVCDLVIAMGGSLDELTEIDISVKTETSANALLYEKTIEDKNKWILRMFIWCSVMTGILFFLVIFDIMNPHWGYVRY